MRTCSIDIDKPVMFDASRGCDRLIQAFSSQPAVSVMAGYQAAF